MSEPRRTGADPDWELLQRVAQGDVEAFAPLVERHQARLLRLCERLLGDPEEARDAAQEVFLRVYRRAGSFRPDGQVFTWIYRIAVNFCLNRLRRKRILRFFSLSPDENGENEGPQLDPIDGAPGPLDRLAARERWEATRQAIDALPANQRAVLILARFEGLSYREIARTLGISEGAVESRLVRAMRRLTAAQESGLPRVSRSEG